MSPAAAFHTQLASIMEVLANTAVAEICELVDSGYSVLQMEISRSRKENEVLRRKLRLLELRTARATALRVTSAANARAPVSTHHQGNEARRNGTVGGQAGLTRLTAEGPQQRTRRDTDPSSDSGRETARELAGESDKLAAVPIKVEDDDDDSWSRSDRERVTQKTDTPALPPPTKQEEEDNGSTPQSFNSRNPRSDDGFDCLMYETQRPHGSGDARDPSAEDPGCSYALNTSVRVSTSPNSGACFHRATPPGGFQDGQQRPSDKPERTQGASVRGDRWTAQYGVSRAASTQDASGRSFVCNCCGKTLACLKNLKTHMRVHTGEKPFVCPLCGKRFSDSSNLKRHQSVHTGEKRYGCIHCGKRFAQSGSLKVHMTVHTDCKQFRCSFCSKTFISSSHLRRHVTVHAGEKRFAPAVQ